MEKAMRKGSEEKKSAQEKGTGRYSYSLWSYFILDNEI